MYSIRVSTTGILLNASEKERETIVESVVFATEHPIRRIYECSTRELMGLKACWIKSDADYGRLLDGIARRWFSEDMRANYLYKSYLNCDGIVHSVRMIEKKDRALSLAN